MLLNPNDINWKQVGVYALFIIALIVSVYFNFKPRSISVTESDKEVARLRSVRDSAMAFSLEKSISIQNYWKNTAKSYLARAKSLEKKDSTNRYYYEKEKGKISHYTSAVSNHVADSILRAAKIRQ